MHESSLARQLLHAALNAIADTPGASIACVRARLAETEQLNPEAISFHFTALAVGTAAAAAKLELEVKHIEARCLACNGVYLPEHHVTLCPQCNSTDAELLGETGMRVINIDVQEA